MKQLALLLAILIGLMLFVFWSSQPGNLEKLVGLASQNLQPKQEKVVKIAKYSIKAEIAKTEQELRAGLSGRDKINSDSGMLFVLEPDTKPAFWMKGVKFPIDIIWIDDGKVTDVTANVPIVARDTTDAQIPKYSPKQPVDYALEVPAGTTESKNIKIGDKVELPSL